MKTQMTEDTTGDSAQRLAWFAAIWLGSVLLLDLVALLIRAVLLPVV